MNVVSNKHISFVEPSSDVYDPRGIAEGDLKNVIIE